MSYSSELTRWIFPRRASPEHGGNRTIRLDLAGTNTGTLSGQLDIRRNGAQLFDIDVGADDTLSVTSVIIGAGSAGLTKEGDGTLIIEANSTYTGATTVNGGTLEISATAGTNVPFCQLPDQQRVHSVSQ